MNYDQMLDIRGLSCAEPIIKITKQLKNIGTGQVLLVTANKISITKDIPAYCSQTGNSLIHQQESDSAFWFCIRKGV